MCKPPAEDRPIALPEAPQVLAEATGFPVSYMGLWRAAKQGTNAADGSRVYLDFWRCGCKLFTTVNAFKKYTDALAEADRRAVRAEAADRDKPDDEPNEPRRPRVRLNEKPKRPRPARLRAERAERQAEAIGL
ncbi:MAG: hypothetical protein AAF328_01180 [Planctomycetota bacterium]